MMNVSCQIQWSTKILKASMLVLILLVLFPSTAQSEKNYTDEAYKLYFKWHTPKEISGRDLYPYPGSLIRRGEDRPICTDAKKAESYTLFETNKFLMHGKDGWLFRTIDFRQDFPLTPKALDYFVRLNKQLAARGQTLIIFFAPPRAMLEGRHIDPDDIPTGYTTENAKKNYQGFLKKMNDAGVITVGISEVPSDMDYFQEGDLHWSLAGVDYTARQLTTVIRKIPSYDAMKKQTFQSEIIGLDTLVRGGFENALQTICKINIQAHLFPQWATIPKTENVQTANDLLGDIAFPAIIALGTSYTAKDNNFNFIGSLKRYLETDVYNAALSGGGFGASSYRYYASKAYHKYPPKIILWEFLSQHNYNSTLSENGFRQIIPAIQGACSEKEAIAKFSGDIIGTTTEFFNGIKDLPLKNIYLYLEVKEPVDRNLQIKILYTDGNADNIDLSRSTFIVNNGKYYLEMGGITDKPAMFFRIETDKPQGHLMARLCRYPENIAGK